MTAAVFFFYSELVILDLKTPCAESKKLVLMHLTHCQKSCYFVHYFFRRSFSP